MTYVGLSWIFPICKQILSLLFFLRLYNYLSFDRALVAAATSSVPQRPFLGRGKKSVHFQLDF